MPAPLMSEKGSSKINILTSVATRGSTDESTAAIDGSSFLRPREYNRYGNTDVQIPVSGYSKIKYVFCTTSVPAVLKSKINRAVSAANIKA